MACFSPLTAFRSPDGGIHFVERRGGADSVSFNLPCGRCRGCRLERSRQWATRIMHEAACHARNCFATLTYDDVHLPENRSLDYPVFQRFMKRLRKEMGPVRFFVAGEYGKKDRRPHFHACLFGVDFLEDRVLHSTGSGFSLFRSPTLERLWPYGFSTIGALTFETAAYTARYVLDKVTGDLAFGHYQHVHPETGEILDLVPEFCHMSLKPGIGASWFDRYHADVFPHDYVVVNGAKAKPPRYYDQRFARMLPEKFEEVRSDREISGAARRSDNTWPRLAVREQVVAARLNLNKRDKI